jgi:hypothetical protein
MWGESQFIERHFAVNSISAAFRESHRRMLMRYKAGPTIDPEMELFIQL